MYILRSSKQRIVAQYYIVLFLAALITVAFCQV